jgi:hypothetical protein
VTELVPSQDHIVELLQVAAAYDNRDIDAPMVAAWSEAARRKSWTQPEALEAVHEHYADETAWLLPGHITRIIRRRRNTNWQD